MGTGLSYLRARGSALRVRKLTGPILRLLVSPGERTQQYPRDPGTWRCMVPVICGLYRPLVSLLFSVCEQWCHVNISPEVVPASLKKSEIIQKETQTLKEKCNPVCVLPSTD